MAPPFWSYGFNKSILKYFLFLAHKVIFKVTASLDFNLFQTPFPRWNCNLDILFEPVQVLVTRKKSIYTWACVFSM